MIVLVDTAVWIDHLHQREPQLETLLAAGSVVTHPMVIGELALGMLRKREQFLADLSNLVQVAPASHGEVLQFIEIHTLYGCGLSLVDVHLLAATRLTLGALLWTRDKRLRSVAEQLKVAWEE